MLIFVANLADRAALAFAQAWPERDIHLLTPADLSTRGWRLTVPDDDGAMAVATGRVLRTRNFEGVFVRLGCVHEDELKTITPNDRGYVAAEMQAFLFAFLSRLKCPVINRPSPGCLCGPNLRPIHWRHLAERSGIRVSIRPSLERVSSVCVVGDQTFGNGGAILHDRARKLARAGKTDLLRVWFDADDTEASMVSADLWPDCSNTEVQAAILGLFDGQVKC